MRPNQETKLYKITRKVWIVWENDGRISHHLKKIHIHDDQGGFKDRMDKMILRHYDREWRWEKKTKREYMIRVFYESFTEWIWVKDEGPEKV